MKDAARPALTAASVMLAYHVVTASVSRGLGLGEERAKWFELGIWLIFSAAGFATAWRFRHTGMAMAVVLTAGLADGVLGWRITAAIYQPMRIVYDNPNAESEFAIEVLVIAAIMGSVGAAGGRLLRAVADRVGHSPSRALKRMR